LSGWRRCAPPWRWERPSPARRWRRRTCPPGAGPTRGDRGRRGLQDALDGVRAPHLPAARRRDVRGVEALGDGPVARAGVRVVAEDAPHRGHFLDGAEDQPRRAVERAPLLYDLL